MPLRASELFRTFTVCDAPAEVLPLKLLSPPYCAVMLLAPPVVEVRLHCPAATAAEQLSVPSLTVTVPVKVPLPGAVGVTVHWTVYACPAFVGAEVSDAPFVIVVVVFALLTVCEAPLDVLPLKLVSPPYCAVSVFGPAVVEVILHWPVATDALQV